MTEEPHGTESPLLHLEALWNQGEHSDIVEPYGTMETILTLWDTLEPRGHYRVAGPYGIKGTTVNTVGFHGMEGPF